MAALRAGGVDFKLLGGSGGAQVRLSRFKLREDGVSVLARQALENVGEKASIQIGRVLGKAAGRLSTKNEQCSRRGIVTNGSILEGGW